MDIAGDLFDGDEKRPVGLPHAMPLPPPTPPPAPPPVVWAKVREFPVPSYPLTYDGPRTDFRETVFWSPALRTDAQGKARVTFPLSDAVTSFRVITEGISTAGLAGRNETVLSSKLPFFMEAKLPLEVAAGDVINLPLTLKNEQGQALSLALKSRFGVELKLMEDVAPGAVELASASGRTLAYPLQVVGARGDAEVSFGAQAQGFKDEFSRKVKVVPVGFPRNDSWSGNLEKTVSHTLNLRGASAGSILARVSFYPSPLASMLRGLESILEEPSGCFEQASSSNYPNVMVLSYLQQRKDVAEPRIVQRANRLLDQGYRMIAGYESPRRGYEWFGGDPGHEALTAYGLMEFSDMRPVYGRVNAEMVRRTSEWLMNRRDGKGGFKRNSAALDSFGAASPQVTNAYIVYALAEAGRKDLDRELEAVSDNAEGSSDPYVVALATRAQLDVAPHGPRGAALAAKLAGMQQADGRFHGTTHSITRSGGRGLDVETTSLAVLALLPTGKYFPQVRKAVQWLAGARSGAGGFGSTQATILALKALTAVDLAFRQTPAAGDITVLVNGKEVETVHFDKGRRDPIVLEGFSSSLTAGENVVELRLNSTQALPYTLSVDYTTADPATSSEAPVRVVTTLAHDAVKMGETVRVTADLENIRDEGLPMTMLRIGIPGGTTFQTWQLKELVEKKVVDFYETRPREVILYFRALAPRAKKQVGIDLVANVPGTYTGPASSAYLYYTAEHKAWSSPLRVRIAPSGG